MLATDNLLFVNTSVGKGMYAEELIAQQIGASRAFHRGYDMSLGKLRLEVKCAIESKTSQYQFCLRKNDKHGYTDCNHSDYIILVCITKLGLVEYFVIPTIAICGKQKLIKLTIDSKKYAQYKVSSLKGLLQ